MKSTFLNLTFLSVLLTVSTAQALRTSAADLLSRDLKSVLKTMSSEIRLYHYFWGQGSFQDLKTPEIRFYQARNQARGAVQDYWNPRPEIKNMINAGPGAYAAIDPVISSDFGDSLIEFTVPVGTAYLDVADATRISKATLNQMKAEKIIKDSEISQLFYGGGGGAVISRDTLKNMVRPEHAAFREFMHKFLLDKNIALIEYNWNSRLAGFCPFVTTSAFVFTGTPQFNSDGTIDDYLVQFPMKYISLNGLIPDLTEDEVIDAERVAKLISVLTKAERSSIFSPKELKQIRSKIFHCLKKAGNL